MELEVKLSKDSWHYKLQKFVFRDDTPDLHSLCPYFWLTIFCIPVSIIVLIYRPIKACIVSIKDSIDKAEEERARKIYKNLTIDSAVEIIKGKKKIDGRKYKGSWDIWALIRSWQWTTGSSDEEAEKFHKKVSEQFDKYEDLLQQTKWQAKLKKEAVKQKLQVGKIVKYTKIVAGVIISLLLLLLLYVIVSALIHASWKVILVKILSVLSILIAGLICFGILIFIVKSFNNVEEHYSNNDDLKWYGYPLYILFNIVKWPFKGIWAVLSFFFSYFSAAKDNYCPGIIWEDSEKVNK